MTLQLAITFLRVALEEGLTVSELPRHYRASYVTPSGQLVHADALVVFAFGIKAVSLPYPRRGDAAMGIPWIDCFGPDSGGVAAGSKANGRRPGGPAHHPSRASLRRPPKGAGLCAMNQTSVRRSSISASETSAATSNASRPPQLAASLSRRQKSECQHDSPSHNEPTKPLCPRLSWPSLS